MIKTSNSVQVRASKNFIPLALTLVFALTGPSALLFSVASASESFPASTNPELQAKEAATLARVKKASNQEASDLLFQFGKLCSDSGDFARAEHYMREAMAIDEKLNRQEEVAKEHYAIAICLTKQGKSAEARKELETVLSLADKGSLVEFKQYALNSLGFVALKSDKFDEAMDYFKKAEELGAANKNPTIQMGALVNQATVERARKQNDKAIQLVQQALSLGNPAEPDQRYATVLLNLARLQHEMNNLDKAIETYKKAIPIFKENLDSEDEANACWSLAETLFDIGRTSESLVYYNQALEALADEPDTPLKLDALIGTGAAQADLGMTEKAVEIHKKAYDLAEKLHNQQKQLLAISQIAYDHLLGGEPEAALFRLLEGEKLIKEGIPAKQKGGYLIAIGRAYKALGEQQQAQKYYEEATQLFDVIGAKEDKALAISDLAVLSLDNKNWEDFEIYQKAAREIFASVDKKHDLATLDFNHGQFLVVRGKFPEAISSYQTALEAFKQGGDRVAEGKTYAALGMCEYLTNHPQQALQYYEQAMKIAEESKSLEALWEAQLGLGKAYKRLGLNDLALSNLSAAVDSVEKERGKITHDSFKTNNLNDRMNSYQELIDLYVRLNKGEAALEIAEKGRARAFLDMLQGKKSGGITTVSSPLASNTPAPSSSPGKSPVQAPQIANLPAIPLGAINKKNSVEQLIAMAEPGTRGVSVLPKTTQAATSFAVSKGNAAAPALEEIKNLVRASKSTVLEYFIIGDKIAVWIVNPDGTINMLPPLPITKPQLDERVSLCYQAVTAHPKNQSEVLAIGQRRQDALKELYDLLVKPIEPALPKDEGAIVTIVPHGSMFMIPFAALMSSDNKYLVEKHTLSYMPAIGVMRATQKLEQDINAVPDKLLAFGNPITKKIEFLGTLPYSEKEVQNVAALFGADKSVVKIGQDADRKNFFELAPNFSEVHLATHGLVDEENPMQSSLVLAPTDKDDGLLTVKDILAMNPLKAKLVVLSACQTGRGRITGDGVVGLSRAFIIAGTPSVLVSQWNVDDLITEFQMKAFYKGYLAKSGKSKSLREAQLATIKLLEGNTPKPDAPRANPRYWSAFQMIGDPL